MIAPRHPAYALREPGNYSAFALMAHSASVKAGWYSLPDGTPKDRNKGEMLALMHSEISEAWEGFVVDRRDDHLPARRNVEVELADYLIRHGDFTAYIRCHGDVDNCLRALADGPTWQLESASMLFNRLHTVTSNMLEAVRKARIETLVINAAVSVRLTLSIANVLNCNDIGGAITEKMDFNAVRADHKREVRGKDGGKAF